MLFVRGECVSSSLCVVFSLFWVSRSPPLALVRSLGHSPPNSPFSFPFVLVLLAHHFWGVFDLCVCVCSQPANAAYGLCVCMYSMQNVGKKEEKIFHVVSQEKPKS